tara:strand:- start:54 stop:614 length:561 start_codon:yes stop_codon:yes gene_type:complete
MEVPYKLMVVAAVDHQKDLQLFGLVKHQDPQERAQVVEEEWVDHLLDDLAALVELMVIQDGVLYLVLVITQVVEEEPVVEVLQHHLVRLAVMELHVLGFLQLLEIVVTSVAVVAEVVKIQLPYLVPEALVVAEMEQHGLLLQTVVVMQQLLTVVVEGADVPILVPPALVVRDLMGSFLSDMRRKYN